MDSLQQNEKSVDLKTVMSNKDQTVYSNCEVCLTLWKWNVDPNHEAGEVSIHKNAANGYVYVHW